MTPAQRALLEAAGHDEAPVSGAGEPVPEADAASPEAQNAAPTSPGRALAAARIDAGLSVADVSRLTFIRPAVVDAVERDDADACGGPVYLRGHVRTVAGALGLDPGALPGVAVAGPAASTPPPPVRLRPRPPAASQRDRSAWSGWWGVAVVALAVVAVLAAVNLLRPHAGGTPTAGSSAKAARTATAGTGHAAAAAPRPTPRPVVPTGVTVTVRVSGGRCWVGVTDSSGSQLFGGSLSSGDSRTFHDPSRLKVTLGNPGVASLRFNGTNLGSPGDVSHIARLTFVPEVTSLAQAMGTAPLPSAGAG